MVRFPYQIRYSLFAEHLDPGPPNTWCGTATPKGVFGAVLGERPTFTIQDGWITLFPTETKPGEKRRQWPVGHALAQLLQTGDAVEIWCDQNDCWTYWLARDDVYQIAVGQFSGKLDDSIRVRWVACERPIDSEATHATVRLVDREFDLGTDEEVVSGRYYARCLYLGSSHMLGGQRPQIALLATENVGIREALRAWFATVEKLRNCHREMIESIKVASSETKVGKLPGEEFMKRVRPAIFARQRERVEEVFAEAGMLRPPHG